MNELIVRWKNGEAAIYRFTTKGDAVTAKMIFENHCKDEIKEVKINVLEQQPSEPRTNLAETSQDCVSREQVEEITFQEPSYTDPYNILTEVREKVRALPSVYPERPNPDVVEKMKNAIDEMTEIHSDGEFYIKNVDAKWIIGKYLYGDEMSGGGEDENRKSL